MLIFYCLFMAIDVCVQDDIGKYHGLVFSTGNK